MTTGQLPMITPDMKVAALLDAFPELEPVLIEMAPAFKKLRNPVLRKTVAKVATLERAAGIAGIPTRELIITLRAASGQPTSVEGEAHGSADGGCVSCSDPNPTTPGGDQRSEAGASIEPPSWFSMDRIRETIDADAMLAAGEVPLGVVLQRAKALAGGDILRVMVGFRPVPLVETLEQQGFQTFCRQPDGEQYELLINCPS